MDKLSFFKNVNYDKSLKLDDGTFIHSYKELINELKLLSDDEFNNYLEKDKDFFISWLADNYFNEELITSLRQTNSRKNYIKTLQKFLKDANINISDLLYERNIIKNRKLTIIHNVWLVVCLIFLIIIIGQQTYYESNINTLHSYNTELLDNLQNLNNHNLVIETDLLDTQEKNTELESRIAYLEDTNQNLISQLAIPIIRGPLQRISEQDITVFGNRVTINIQNPLFAKFTDTGSMHPTINSDSKAIQIIPKSQEDISVGDIISFNQNDESIIHRVIEIGEDQDGWYAITKGDNNLIPDSQKVRFSDIERILVVIIY